MWGLHLKQKGRWWHYYRSVPKTYHDVDARRLISFSLKTSDFSEAKLKAAQFSIQLDDEWRAAKERGVSLVAQDAAASYQAATEVQKSLGFVPKSSGEMFEPEIVERLRALLSEEHPAPEQKAVLGLIEPPQMTMGLVNAAGAPVLDNVRKLAQFIFSTGVPPDFSKAAAWAQTNLGSKSPQKVASSNAAQGLLKKKRKLGKLNRKRGRR